MKNKTFLQQIEEVQTAANLVVTTARRVKSQTKNRRKNWQHFKELAQSGETVEETRHNLWQYERENVSAMLTAWDSFCAVAARTLGVALEPDIARAQVEEWQLAANVEFKDLQ